MAVRDVARCDVEQVKWHEVCVEQADEPLDWADEKEVIVGPLHVGREVHFADDVAADFCQNISCYDASDVFIGIVVIAF